MILNILCTRKNGRDGSEISTGVVGIADEHVGRTVLMNKLSSRFRRYFINAHAPHTNNTRACLRSASEISSEIKYFPLFVNLLL